MTETAIAGAATAPAAPPVAPEPPAASPTPDAATQPTATVDYQAEAEKWKALARKHEAQAKANVAAASDAETQKANLAKVLAALGVENTAAADPAAITAQLQAAQAAERQRSTELAVLRAASRLEADGDALLDSRSFLDSIKDVDPSDPAAVSEAIKAAVTANPKFARAGAPAAPAAPAPRRTSGGQFDGAPGGNRQWTAEDVARATPAQVAKAMRDGLLNQHLSA